MATTGLGTFYDTLTRTVLLLPFWDAVSKATDDLPLTAKF
jgi:hypothetical protein